MHGTGVRSSDGSATYNKVKDKLLGHSSDLKVVRCDWGGQGSLGLGAR